MKKQVRIQAKLKLSKETLRALTTDALQEIVGGISTQPIPDSCGYTEGFTCSEVAACSCWGC